MLKSGLVVSLTHLKHAKIYTYPSVMNVFVSSMELLAEQVPTQHDNYSLDCTLPIQALAYWWFSLCLTWRGSMHRAVGAQPAQTLVGSTIQVYILGGFLSFVLPYWLNMFTLSLMILFGLYYVCHTTSELHFAFVWCFLSDDSTNCSMYISVNICSQTFKHIIEFRWVLHQCFSY